MKSDRSTRLLVDGGNTDQQGVAISLSYETRVALIEVHRATTHFRKHVAMRDNAAEHSGKEQANESEDSPRLDFPTFLRMFQMRKGQIMWFLDAGASGAAGVKTAGDMIWEFKRNLYCSEKKQPLSVVSDLGDPVVRRKLQAQFDSAAQYPPEGSEDEYAAYFEKTFPSPKDRRAYIEGEIKFGNPSFGHFGLALLLKQGIRVLESRRHGQIEMASLVQAPCDGMAGAAAQRPARVLQLARTQAFCDFMLD